MKVVISIKDSALDAFMQPWYVQTAAQAVRSFNQEVNNPESPMNRTPDDFDLYELGTFDENTGQHHNHETPQRLARAKDMKE